MPKAYPSQEEEAAWAKQQREREFDEGMRAHHDTFLKSLSEAKPYLDFVSLLTIHAIITGLFSGSVTTLLAGRSPERSIGIIAICFFLYGKLFSLLSTTTQAMAGMSLIGLSRLLRMPYPFGQVRSATLRWFVDCYIFLVSVGLLVAAGWVGYDIGQRTISAFGVEIHSDTKTPDAAKKAPDTKAPDTKAPEATKKAEPPPSDPAKGGNK